MLRTPMKRRFYYAERDAYRNDMLVVHAFDLLMMKDGRGKAERSLPFLESRTLLDEFWLRRLADTPEEARTRFVKRLQVAVVIAEKKLKSAQDLLDRAMMAGDSIPVVDYIKER